MQETIEDKRNGGLRARNTKIEALMQRDNKLTHELNEPEKEPTI